MVSRRARVVLETKTPWSCHSITLSILVHASTSYYKRAVCAPPSCQCSSQQEVGKAEEKVGPFMLRIFPRNYTQWPHV